MIVDYESQDFRKYWQTPSKRILHALELRIIKELLPQGPGWLVDLGAGYGRLLPSYYAENKRIVLVDYSIKHLQMAAETMQHKNVRFIAANAYRLPFRNSVFSTGICVRLLHHLDNPEGFARELFRVLDQGGHSIVSFMNKRSLLRIFRYGMPGFRRDHSLIDTDTFGTHPVFFRDVFMRSGFSVKRRKGAGLLHQVVTTAPVVELAVGSSPMAEAVFSRLASVFDGILGVFGLALMQYILLEKKGLGDHSSDNRADLEEILACPGCGAADLHQETLGYRCGSCNLDFRRTGEVLDFRYPRSS